MNTISGVNILSGHNSALERELAQVLNELLSSVSWLHRWEFEPSKALNEISVFTEQVNDECPVAKLLGVSGIGEGLVWTCLDNPTSRFWFKSKGVDHEVNPSRTKMDKIAIEPEKVENSMKFVDNTFTETRSKQGIDYLKAPVVFLPVMPSVNLPGSVISF